MVFILFSALGVHVGFDAHSVGLTENRSSGDPLLTRDMTEKEILRLIHGTMPYPVLSVRHGTQGDRRHFAINMNIAALKKSEPVFNVTFHVPVSADRIIVERAVHAAANYAIRSLSRLR
jgi:hypothetical protein